MRIIIVFLSLFSCVLFSKTVAAYSCTTASTVLLRTVSTITVPRDAPVGSLLGVAFPSVTPFNCDNSSPSLSYQEFGVKAYGTYVMTINGRRVYSTNLQGIGYSVYSLTDCTGSSTATAVDGTNTLGGDVNTRLLCKANGMINTATMSSVAGMVFYKTASTTGSGTVTQKTVGSFILRNNQSSWQTPELAFGFYSFAVQSTACTLNNSVVGVDMGNVKKSEFHGIDTWPGGNNTKNFNIALSCDPGVAVSLKVDGITTGGSYNAAKGILGLTTSDTAATGVGIQLLYNNAPLPLGTFLSMGTAASTGTMNIPLQARYYQTGNTVKPGKANSLATVTMTYQ